VAVVALAVLTAPIAAFAEARDQLTGLWRDTSGNVVEFRPTGGTTWAGTSVGPRYPGYAGCFTDIHVSGADGRYTGTTVFFHQVNARCSRLPDGTITLTLEPGGTRLDVLSVPPGGVNCGGCAPTVWSKVASPLPPTPWFEYVITSAVVVLAATVAAAYLKRRRARRAGTVAPQPSPARDDVAAVLTASESATARRVLLTDPDVLPAATTLRFAALVLMLVATTGSVYAHLAVLAHPDVEATARACTSAIHSNPGSGNPTNVTRFLACTEGATPTT
jgi:hypothetical protein